MHVFIFSPYLALYSFTVTCVGFVSFAAIQPRLQHVLCALYLLFTGICAVTHDLRQIHSGMSPHPHPTPSPPRSAGQHAVASVYAPIMYPPLPLLAFKISGPACAATEGHGPAQLAAVGSVRSCDPDRINLKRIVLTGAPGRQSPPKDRDE